MTDNYFYGNHKFTLSGMSYNMDTKEPFVSILTPVYNGEEYLQECIKSILAQTYENWEYVIVNNCSTDRSLEIAQKYAEKDERIRIHNNKQFLSLIPNLNHAFRQISDRSKYCKVIHSDDWLFPECVERMVSIAVKYPNAGIVSSYRLVEKKVEHDCLPYPSHITPGIKICRQFFLEGSFVFGSPSSILIRSDLIRKQDNMYDAHLHGDLSACFKILQESDFGFCHQVLTFTRRHNESSSTRVNKYETYQLGDLKALLAYGPDYLSEEEMDEQVQKFLNKYYRFLARKCYELKPKDFWKFHATELKALGYPIRYTQLGKYVLAMLLNLRSTLGKLKKALKDNISKKF